MLMLGDDCRLYTWALRAVVGTGTNAMYAPAPMPMKGLEDLCRPEMAATEPDTLQVAPLPTPFQREEEFRFYVLGNVAKPIVLQRSTDLREWTAIFTNGPLSGFRMVADTNVGRASGYFYRTMQ